VKALTVDGTLRQTSASHTKSLPLGVLEEKKHALRSKILCSALERILEKTWATSDERWNGGESKLGSRQVSAVDGLHKAKQLKHEDHKMMRQLFMQGTVILNFISLGVMSSPLLYTAIWPKRACSVEFTRC